MDDNFSSKRYEPPFIDLNNKDNSHTQIIEYTGYNKKVLEIGTSTGYVTKILHEHQNEIVGIEIDPDAAQLAEKYCSRMVIGDIEKIDLDKLFNSSSFDVIICGDVLEHLINPSVILKNLKKFLKINGFLVVSLPNFCHGDVILNILDGDFHYTDMGILDKTHLRFFGLKNIYTLFIDAGYQISALSSTRAEIGETEIKLRTEKIPIQLRRFIQSLPESSTYQYIFTAYPSENPLSPLIEETEFGKIFAGALEGTVKNINELEQKNTELKRQFQHLETILTDRNHQVQLLQQENNALKRSSTYQVTTKIHRTLVQPLFPLTTRRRRFYDLVLDGGRILVNEGPGMFWKKTTKKIFRRLNGNDTTTQYSRWITNNEYQYLNIDVIRTDITSFTSLPKISIVVPVWEVDKIWLIFMIESVINQHYQNWELCIADANSKKPHVKKILTDYMNKDPRIKVKFLKENFGISENTNEAINIASGEYIGFLDHDDELAPFALYEVVKYINTHIGVKLIYSDEDKINDKGIRLDPFFKPDWAPDQFLSQNYLCHFCVIKKELLIRTGKLRKEFDGSQDYDLLLRLTEIISDREIGHIQKILYHWRVTGNSTSGNPDAKPYAAIAAKKALAEALARRGIAGHIEEGLLPGSFRALYEIHNFPEVTIIIPTKDKAELLRVCIQSILDKTTYLNYRILIVDNESSEPDTFAYYDSLRDNAKISMIQYKKPFNFSAMNNDAVAKAGSPYILFLNNDIEVISGNWLAAMLEHIQRPGIGAVGAKLLYPDNTVQHAGVIIGLGGVAGHSHKQCSSKDHGYLRRMNIIHDVSAVTAACMLMKKDLFESVGGFDEDLAIAFNDVDLCLKIRELDQLIVYTPYAQLYHHESVSRGYEDTPEKDRRFQQEIRFIRDRWGEVIDRGDPFYNPNLTLDREDYSLNDSRC